MYPNGNLQNSSSGERHSSHEHYAMSQVNNEQPVIHREHEEHNQTWGQPKSSSSSPFYPSNIDANRLTSSSSSLFDRNNPIFQDNFGAKDNKNYQQQSYTNQYQNTGQTISPQSSAYRQKQQSSTSSSYSKISNISRQQQQPGIQHFHSVPYYHGFKFQAIPGFPFFTLMRKELI
jgi:hypothetical protein